GRVNQQSVIAARVHAGDGRGGKAAQTVRLQPFTAERGIEIGADVSFDPYRHGSLSGLLQELSDQAGPAGLMACADARAVVAVEVFVKQNEVAPVRIVMIAAVAAVHRTSAVFILEEDARQPARQFGGNFPQRDVAAGAG